MKKQISTHEYFRMAETNRPAELVYGYVRDPPAPSYGHQKVVGRLYRLLSEHADANQLGDVLLSPIDVVLDRDAALVVQPDLVFVSAARSSIICGQVWGAPDLVVEVASASSARRDRTLKLSWYRKYGVRECWLLYPLVNRVDVVYADGSKTWFDDTQTLVSHVLPELKVTAGECFQF